MKKLLYRIGGWFKRKTKATGIFTRNMLYKLTFLISKAMTGFVLILGALVNIRNPERLAIAGLIFLIGCPVGLIIFGPKIFSFTLWLGIVIVTLFVMNLHNCWEVCRVLKNGGLDYEMAAQAVAATETVVKTPKQIHRLNESIKELNIDFKDMAAGHEGYDGGILVGSIPGKPLLETS